MYISKKFDFDAEELKTELSNVGMDFGELELENLLCIEEIKTAFTKFSGIRLNWTWEEFYRYYFNFLAPLYFYLKGDIIYPMIWNKERGVWFRDDSSGHN